MSKKNTQLPFSAKLKNPPPKKLKNETYRTREFLTEQEINQLRTAARRHGRHGHRDDTLILMMFRHGLRVSEAIALRWEQVDLRQGLTACAPSQAGHPGHSSVAGYSAQGLAAVAARLPANSIRVCQ